VRTTPTPNRLVVLACFDPDGEVAPHVRRHIEAWQGECRRLIVVTTSRLTAEARSWLRANAELVERENYGYDFSSYRSGLSTAGDLSGYDEVVVCNDTFVGPLRPYSRIFAEMAGVPVDFWGITLSGRIEPHVQSFFVVFRRWVVGSKAFVDFWRHLAPVSDRRQVIRRYEVGLSSRLVAAGFTMGSYFSESQRDRLLARLRVAWWVLRRRGGRAGGYRSIRERVNEPWNPTYALADAALDGGRLPLVKLDVLRLDPYGLGSTGLLRRCEREYPAAFAGVAAFLDRTRSRSPGREGEDLRPAPLPVRPLGRLVGYR
jgi:rhamnan synthesis protein F